MSKVEAAKATCASCGQPTIGRMSERDEALLFVCDEAACREDPMFYEIFAMDDRWMIIRRILDAAVASGKLARTDAPVTSGQR